MAKVTLSYEQAKAQAERLKAALLPGCERIEIAGSIRREKPIIGDIEIVCVPVRQRDMFNAYSEKAPSLIDPILARLIDEGQLLPAEKDGEKYKKFAIPAVSGLHLDPFGFAQGRLYSSPRRRSGA